MYNTSAKSSAKSTSESHKVPPAHLPPPSILPWPITRYYQQLYSAQSGRILQSPLSQHLLRNNNVPYCQEPAWASTSRVRALPDHDQSFRINLYQTNHAHVAVHTISPIHIPQPTPRLFLRRIWLSVEVMRSLEKY